jgi:hypothetical protein
MYLFGGKTMRYLFILWCIVMILLCSCSPEKRIARIARKHPEVLVKDTLMVRDTIITQGSTLDSTFIFSGDTVYVRDGRQEIKYFYNTTTQHHYIKGEVKPDTIYFEKKVPFEKIVVSESRFWSGFRWGLATWVMFGAFCVLFWFFKKPNRN